METMNDKITGVKTIKVDSSATGHNIIVLDRIEEGWTPPYCIHGRATCVGCDNWVYLGHTTHDVVASGSALPMCQQCAVRNVPKGAKPITHFDDHLRADGPHE